MLINKLKHRLSNQYIGNISWMGGAEFANRIFRLGTTVIVARVLNPYDYGLVAVVLATNEIINIFTLKAGIGAKLIQASKENVAILCDTVYWMNWILCIGLFIIQCFVAFPIAWFYGDNRVILPICVISITYLFLPFYAVQIALIFRENKFKTIALCNISQSLFGSIITVILALLGMGIWAIILPIVLTHPLWVIINLMNHRWRPTKSFTLYRWQEISSFALNVLGVEILNKLRANLDYLIIGRFLGIDNLGIYYFAFNAGIGISLNVINTLTWSLLPYFCEAREQINELKKRYFSSLKVIASIIVPLVLLQSALAPIYVPIIFGQKWVDAIPILVVICLSAIPRPFAEAAGHLLKAFDKPSVDLYFNLLFTVIFVMGLLFAVHWGILWVAVSVLVSHIVIMPIFSVCVSRYVFYKK
ncbi:membrane protein involved in the export of O-antigen and teichoic acid [Cylindrospermum stagnale PCC 7417]|uniref:Membrane protein involved in the export of O-antigen and teichoic acid n=1 Tax=Cylindrospermum stagnale PCC 7417 TaxID=56107 RepID=K9WT51_9NOST|nr:lipopolysaccharide biosynthesis protein [Cylindrospermum stagnale]AFZ22702.1 membrane protein involved in the export of O-antigen and teichoic acid [Cylindrospermum stagnale PCC 7417]